NAEPPGIWLLQNSAVASAEVQMRSSGTSRPDARSRAARSRGVKIELLVSTRNGVPDSTHWWISSGAPGSAWFSCTSTPSMSVSQLSMCGRASCCGVMPTAYRRAARCSAEQSGGGDARPLGERLDLRPGDLRVHPSAEPAVGRGDDVVGADDRGEGLDAVGDELGMLHDVGRVPPDARDHLLACGQLHLAPQLPLVLVPCVGRLERVGAGVHLEHEVDDVPELDVGRVRAVPAAPTEVVADAVLRQVAQRPVEGLDVLAGERAVVADARLGVDLVP